MSSATTIFTSDTEDRHLESNRLVFGIAQALEVALRALGFASGADTAAVPDQLVRENDPFIHRDDGHQILLNFLRVFIARQVQFGVPVR